LKRTNLILLALALLLSIAPLLLGGAAPEFSGTDGQAMAARALGIPSSSLVLQTLAALPEAGSPGTIDLVLGGRSVTLELVPHSVRAPDFRVLVVAGDGVAREVPPPPSATWRGAVAGEPGSRVLMAQVRGQLHGSVLLPGQGDTQTRWWCIMPAAVLLGDAAVGLAAVFREDELPPSGATCGVAEAAAQPPVAPPTPAIEFAVRRSPAEAAVLRLACDADLEYYTASGSSVAATVADIEAVVNGMSDLYELDLQTIIQVGDIIVRTADPYPYTTTNPTALLVEERTEWMTNRAGIVRNAVQLFTGRDLDGTAIGIGFSDAAICGTYSNYNLVQSRYTAVMANRFALSAHELGHNCDGAHCDYMDFICRVMCPSIGGCSAGIRSFGPWEVNRIGGYLADVSCLGTAELNLPRVSLPFTETFAAASIDPAKWAAVDQVYVSTGRLYINHGGGYSPTFYLGTIRTLPIVVPGRVDISYKVRPSNVTAGQRLKVEYFDTATRVWMLLNTIVAPGGTPADYTTWTHTTPPEAAGDLFCLRFSAYGDAGVSSSDWLVDDVAIAASISAAPGDDLPAALLRDVWPNPFNPRTNVLLRIDRERRVEVAVYDLSGRRVTLLLDEVVPEGARTLVWDGRDDRGRPVSSGAYVVRMVSEGRGETRPVSLIR
jgi:hypothetical protein